MNKEKLKRLLDDYLAADKELVESWNRDFAWGETPPLEARIEFLKVRQMNSAKAIVAVLSELTAEETSSGESDGR